MIDILMGKREETSEKLEVLVVFEIIARIHFPDGFDYQLFIASSN